MAEQSSHPLWRHPIALRGAAILVVIYALGAAWLVTDDREPEPLRLERTDEGRGVVVSGAVANESDRQALIDAVGTVTGAEVIIARLVVDPDADPVPAPLDVAAELAITLGLDGD